MNAILNTDSYKMSHHKMYPPGLRYMGSYLEARLGAEFTRTVFFGLRYLMEKHLAGAVVTREKIDEAEALVESHMGAGVFNRAGWERILSVHDGRLPLLIRAVPEGSVIPTSDVMLTVENTDPEVPWLTNHVETLLLQVWYPSTVATISYYQRKALHAALERSGTPGRLPHMLHDFGFRGSSSLESAGIGGAAHLLNFRGSDNIAGMRFASKHYGASVPVGESVPAAEHSTVTMWGRDGEHEAYRHILSQFPTGTVSIVSDSWDITNACREIYGRKLHKEITENTSRNLVIRPDSGEPAAGILSCLEALSEAFGYTVNGKGYKVLGHVSILQGDGISYRTLPKIIKRIMDEGWSADNLVFGSGGGLLQDCNRDTQKFAIKCNWADVNGETRDVYKDPRSDRSKQSKRGRLKLIREHGIYLTVRDDDEHAKYENQLGVVFQDGSIYGADDFDRIRARVDDHFKADT